MRKLRSEMHRRMLGNGYCARSIGLDCHFESICESCTYFQTTIEFRPILDRQRQDAATKGQVGRQDLRRPPATTRRPSVITRRHPDSVHRLDTVPLAITNRLSVPGQPGSA